MSFMLAADQHAEDLDAIDIAQRDQQDESDGREGFDKHEVKLASEQDTEGASEQDTNSGTVTFTGSHQLM